MNALLNVWFLKEVLCSFVQCACRGGGGLKTLKCLNAAAANAGRLTAFHNSNDTTNYRSRAWVLHVGTPRLID